MIQNTSAELKSTAHKVTVIYYSSFYICLFEIVLMLCYILLVVRDSPDGIATRYGLDGPGIESRWG
jgi:hypothetical protein